VEEAGAEPPAGRGNAPVTAAVATPPTTKIVPTEAATFAVSSLAHLLLIIEGLRGREA
jgi:hypothetical protein